MYQSLFTSLEVFLAEALLAIANYMPSIIGALILLVVGSVIANGVKGLVTKLFESLQLSKAVSKTPIEHFLQNADIKMQLETVLGTAAYWLVMLVVLQSVVSILGLNSLAHLLSSTLAYIPRVIAAIVVLFFGVLLAGLVESFVKGALRTIDASSSRMFGKVASYLVVIVAVLAAISELGIANEFILILFVGFIAALSLAMGLAFGLGGQDLVRDLLKEWYKKAKKNS